MSSSTTQDKSSNFKKYLIVFVCMLLQAIPFAVAQNIQPLFISYVINDFGFSLAGFSLLFTFGSVASAIFSPFLGKLFGKVNIKVLFIIGTTLSSIGFLGFGFATTLPQFYVLSAISQVGCVLFSSLGVPYVINHWFPKKGRGKALGIAFAGGSIGNVFLQQIASTTLANKGESYSYILFGLLALVFSLPVILFLIRLPKADEIEKCTCHLEPEHKIKNVRCFEGLGSKITMKNIHFWIFGVGYALIGISISALSTQYATYFTADLKMDAILIGSLGSLFAIFSLIGNVVGGSLFDKLGTFKTMAISMLLSLISISALILAEKNHSLAIIFSIAYGLNVYSFMSAPSFMATDIFGKKDSSVILGIISLMFALGFATGSSLFGLITDNIGFIAAWSTMLICSFIGYILLLSSIKIIKKQNLLYIKA